jgi:hypothetical protein
MNSRLFLSTRLKVLCVLSVMVYMGVGTASAQPSNPTYGVRINKAFESGFTFFTQLKKTVMTQFADPAVRQDAIKQLNALVLDLNTIIKTNDTLSADLTKGDSIGSNTDILTLKSDLSSLKTKLNNFAASVPDKNKKDATIAVTDIEELIDAKAGILDQIRSHIATPSGAQAAQENFKKVSSLAYKMRLSVTALITELDKENSAQ